MEGTSPIGIDTGIPYGSAKERYLLAHYTTLDRISGYITQTAGRIDAQKLQTMVEFAVAIIPDIEQGHRCIQYLEQTKKRELKRLMDTRKHQDPDQQDIWDATISACMATLQLLQMIIDDDCGIRERNVLGIV